MTHCFPNKASINELFVSVQGEGPFAGIRQAFVRFAECNLDCVYCDTDFSEKMVCDYKHIVDFAEENRPFHSIALTGGEPLLQVDFLKQLLPAMKEKRYAIYLETNGSLYKEMDELELDEGDIVAVDIKLPSVAKTPQLWKEHSQFLSILKKKSVLTVVKMILDKNISEEDISESEKLIWDFDENRILCLQPVSNQIGDKELWGLLLNLQKRFMRICKEVRILPQMHKLAGLK